jgi:type IV secretion system protein VirB10
MSPDINPQQERNAGEDAPEVEQELSQVATNPKQSMLILVGISAVFLYLFFNLFINGDDSDTKKEDTPIPTDVSKPVQIDTESGIPSIPTLPSPPKLEDPTPPPPPETEALPLASEELPELLSGLVLPSNATNNRSAPSLPFGNSQDDESRKRMEAKRKSSIVLVAGTPATKTVEQLQQEADFKYRGDMNLVLGRGKMLDATIETAINTDFGGEIRAIISRAVYSEWGKNILLPKGSRVFGSYAMGIESGAYGRISIEWTRVDLANGYSLNLSGSGMDSLGKKGTKVGSIINSENDFQMPSLDLPLTLR